MHAAHSPKDRVDFYRPKLATAILGLVAAVAAVVVPLSHSEAATLQPAAIAGPDFFRDADANYAASSSDSCSCVIWSTRRTTQVCRSCRVG